MTRRAGLSNRERQIALTHATFDWNNQPVGSTKATETLSNTMILEAEQLLKNAGMTINDVLVIEQTLLRITRKERANGSSISEEEMFQKLAKRLIKGASSEIIPFLKETENHYLYFDDLDQLLCMFSWIQKKTEEELGQKDARRQGRRSGRIIKDTEFWKNVYSMSCQLFGFFQDHWGCLSEEKGMIPIQSAQVTIRAFEITYKLMSTVPPCKVLHLVRIAHQAGIELQHIERLALTHVPMRIDDFIQLIADKILTPKTCQLFLNNPELIRALAYEGIRHLFLRWQHTGRKISLLVFAQSIRHELYPNALPDGKKIDWEVLERPRLVSFLNALNRTGHSGESFFFPDHAYAPGLYQPTNALVLLTHSIILSSQKEEKIPPEEYEELQLDEEEEKHEWFCEDTLALWMQRGEFCFYLLDDPCLFTSKEGQAPSPEPVTVNPWDDVLSLIKEDIYSQTHLVDPDLLVLNQKLHEIETLLHLAYLGDVEGILDQWSIWIDPIRERIKKLEERLQQKTFPTTDSVETLEKILPVIAPDTSVEIPIQETSGLEIQKTSPPIHKQIPVEKSQTKKEPKIPEGELGTLVEETQQKLKQLPSGVMRRQFKGQLDTLISKAVQDSENSFLKAHLIKLQTEIQSLLDEISA